MEDILTQIERQNREYRNPIVFAMTARARAAFTGTSFDEAAAALLSDLDAIDERIANRRMEHAR